MATLNIIPETKQSPSAMRGVINYCIQEKKTFDMNSDRKLITGVNCIGQNAYVPFPQDSYSNLVGSQVGERRYRCATSAAWTMPNTLMLKVQIIDTYFGVMNARFGFKDETRLALPW